MSDIEVLSFDEIKELLKMPMDMRTRALIGFQYASGCRIGELLNYTHKHQRMLKDKNKTPIKDKLGNIKYKYWQTRSTGLKKSDVHVNQEKGIIRWKMRNFKTKNEKKKFKYPFVSRKREGLLWRIITVWLDQCGETVFPFQQALGRKLVKNQFVLYAEKTGKHYIKSYASHALRRSRATHLVSEFNHNPYEIMDALGHTDMKSGLHYVATANRLKKMQAEPNKVNQ